MLRKLLLIAGAAIGGIYLTSDEGKNARESLLKKKSTFEPIIKDLIAQSNEILEGTKSIDSKEVKANIDLLVDETKKSLLELDLDKTAETIKEAIRVASKKLRVAMVEAEKANKKTSAKKPVKVSSNSKTKAVKKANK